MKRLKKPTATGLLFDLEASAWWSTQLSPAALQRLATGWQGVFHRTIVGLLEAPAEALGTAFDEVLGRPSKELYAMSGLLLIMEFKNWTMDEAAEAWTQEAGVQYALHLPRDRQYLCARTVDNYRRLVRENVDVQAIFATVTSALVKELELDIARQRLDSTHVHSQMAQLGRQQLLAVAVRRFLVQLQKKAPGDYAAVAPELRARYEPAETRLFGFGTKQALPREAALAQVCEDLAALVERFGGAERSLRGWRSLQALVQLLAEHCEVRADRTVVVRRQSVDAAGGSTQCLQNPSDPGAGYSGHKGPGYQVQLAQTLPPRDAQGKIEGPGLVVACVPQSAAVRDNEALPGVLAQQQAAGLLPTQTVADTLYGSDANVQACAVLGVRLVSPVGGQPPTKGADAKHSCSRQERELKARLAARRVEQETAAWRQTYAQRSGIEGLNRALDVVTGCKQLRVRGTRAVDVAVTLKVTGWNIRAAAQTLAHRARARRRHPSPQGSTAARRRRADQPTRSRFRPPTFPHGIFRRRRLGGL